MPVTPSSVAASLTDPPTPISPPAADNCVLTRDTALVTTSGSVAQSLAAARLLGSPE